MALDIKDAINVVEHYTGKQKRRSFVFGCRFGGCDKTIRIEKSAFKKCSGFCRTHARANKDTPFVQTFNAIRRAAFRKHLDFTITYEDFLFLTQIGVCHYCGEAKIDWKPFVGHGSVRYNLDRKDNTRGYTTDNVVVCCKDCNMMKRDWLSYEEFKIVSLFLRRWRTGTLEDKQELEYMLSAWNMQIS